VDLQLTGLKAVVTGGSRGIGAAIVRTLATEGCHVSFCARDQERVVAMLGALQGLPGTVVGKSVDVTNRTQFEDWLSELGACDIFIPNVSALSGSWDAALRVDVKATIETTEATLPYLQSSKFGAITYIGSKAGSLASPTSAGYGAAKAAMAHYMKSLSSKLLPSVRVNIVSPGDTLFDGGLWDGIRMSDPAQFERVLGRNPMGRLATPDEVARVAAFVSSPAASFVSGANWYVDGGSISHVQI